MSLLSMFRTAKEADPDMLQKLSYDTILGAIRRNKADPQAGTGRWSAEEELANDLFKMFRLADPHRVARVAPDPLEAPAINTTQPQQG